MRLAAAFVLNQELSRSVFYPLYTNHLMDFVLRSTGKAMGDHIIKWGGKTLLDLDYNEKKNYQCNSTNAEINKHQKKKKKKKKKNRRRKEECFPALVINLDQNLNEALTLLIHPIT